jgi:hypothetical protein
MRRGCVAAFLDPLDFFVFLITSVLPLPVNAFRFAQASADKIHLFLWRRNAPLRFLLKRMQHINRFRKSNCIHRPPSVTVMLGDNLQHQASAKASQRFGRGIGFSLLGGVKSLPYVTPGCWREGSDVSPA